MAFVARAERVLALGNGLLPRTPDAVGPGVYSTQNQDMGNSSKKRVNFVPFSSSSVRRVDATADLDIYSPGPGEYIQHSFLDDARKKSTCVSVFHSTTQRSEVPVSDVPGAGTYDLQHDWNKKNAHRTQLFVHRLSQHMQPFPVSTVPSIPVQEQACGYEETRDGRLVLQKRSRIRHVGVNEDKVGPGEYDTDQGADLVAHSNVGTAWSKFKQKRSTLVPKARSFLPGPGTYDPEILQRPKTQGKWPSSSFKSTTPRAAPNADYGERLSSPGPGAYSPGELQRPRTNPPSFGTTSDRLVPLSGAEILNTPGPGTYGVVETFQNPRRIHTADAAVGFGSATLRCVEPKMSPNLGPGAYDTEMDMANSLLLSNFSSVTSFGSTAARFKPVKEKYPPSTTGKQPVREGRIPEWRTRTDKPNSVFISNSKRISQELTGEKAIGPGPWRYYQEQPWVHRSSSRVAPFDSSLGRTSDTFGVSAAQRVPGPGSYNAPVPRTPGSNSAASSFESNTIRFASADTLESMVGPGYYSPQYDSMNKRSYNITVGCGLRRI